jgi:hypothetical protein
MGKARKFFCFFFFLRHKKKISIAIIIAAPALDTPAAMYKAFGGARVADCEAGIRVELDDGEVLEVVPDSWEGIGVESPFWE